MTTIVVPTIREDNIKRWVEQWKEYIGDAKLIIVEDNPKKTFSVEADEHYAWDDIDKDLGRKSWIIPRRTDGVRNYGLLKAKGSDVIITMDDDCYPAKDDAIKGHEVILGGRGVADWVNTVDGPWMRGVPYNIRNGVDIVLNVGLWEGVPDFDAPTQLTHSPDSVKLKSQIIPRGSYFPMCGMNLSFRKEMLPMMYFPLMGKDQPYDRFADIWCGIVAKKIIDHLGYAAASGRPHIYHSRASNVWKNLKKEVGGLEENESFWKAVDEVELTGKTVEECYLELWDKVKLYSDYWENIKKAAKIWTDLTSL